MQQETSWSRIVLRVAVAAFVSVLTLGTSTASAGGYFGISVGQSKSDYTSSRADADFTFYTSGVSVDGSDTGWKMYGGYTFNRNFGIEFGYVDLGKTDISQGSSADEYHSTGFNVILVGSYPFNQQFSIFGKAGLGIISGKYYCVRLCGGVSDTDKSSTVPIFGVGAQFAINPGFSLRAEVERYDGVTIDLSGVNVFSGARETELSYDLFTVAAVFNF